LRTTVLVNEGYELPVRYDLRLAQAWLRRELSR
jgi:hypothetical protein